MKIADGRVLGLLDKDWDYANAEVSLRSEGQDERTYAGLPVTIDESVKCPSLKQRSLAVGWGIGITKSCKDPVRAVKFLDWICSDEGQILLNWGIEGVNYYYDENGKPLHFPVDNYYYEGKRNAVFLGEPVIKYHRTLTTYISTLIKKGFAIMDVQEPQPPEEMLVTVPGMRDEMRRPMMLIVSARKENE